MAFPKFCSHTLDQIAYNNFRHIFYHSPNWPVLFQYVYLKFLSVNKNESDIMNERLIL